MSKPTLTYNCPKLFDQMTKIEGSSNRFCGGCEKEIVNFTKMSDEEIKLFFKTEKKVCGYFYKNQLENRKVSFFEKALLNAKYKIETHSMYLKIPLFALIGGLLFLSACYSSTTGKVEKNEDSDINHDDLVNQEIQLFADSNTIDKKKEDLKSEENKTPEILFYSDFDTIDLSKHMTLGIIGD